MERPTNLTRRLELDRHARNLRVQVTALVGLLDEEGQAIPASEVQRRLGISPRTYQQVCRSLLHNPQEGLELYVTQEGVILRRNFTAKKTIH